MYEIHLKGCRVTPLAGYLKALAVLRLVAEQIDPSATGRWEGDSFVLHTRLSEEELVQFFLYGYAPAPVTAPWNGGSGYFPKDNSTSLVALANSESPRFHALKFTILASQNCLDKLGLSSKPGDAKQELLQELRNRLPDDAIRWMDAAIVLTEEKPSYPPILGTGGNDGRLEFTNNFMQRLLDVMTPAGDPTPNSGSLIRAALFDDVTSDLSKDGAIGQFNPSAAGGANATTGFDSGSLINPWEFILMIEGALSFSSTITKRIETNTFTGMAAPFVVYNSPGGYGTAAESEDSRAEMWLPIWDRFVSFNEIQIILGEGRVRLGRRYPRNGLDFARAVASLGVDRGITAFERVGIQQRNGLSYFAVPLGRFRVVRNPAVDFLRECDEWLDQFFRFGRAKEAPARVRAAANSLESAILRMTQVRDRETTQGVLFAIGRAEQAAATSRKWAIEKGVRPIAPLDAKWRDAAATDDPEWRLANALTATFFNKQYHVVRTALEPSVLGSKGWTWLESTTPDHVQEGNIVDLLHRLIDRWLLNLAKNPTAASSPDWPVQSAISARLDDIAAFLAGQIDEARLFDAVRALMLVKTNNQNTVEPSEPAMLPAFYGLLRLCFSPYVFKDAAVALEPRIFRLAAAGNSNALDAATRRLAVSGQQPKIEKLIVQPEFLQRAAAALAFPISYSDTRKLNSKLILSNEERG